MLNDDDEKLSALLLGDAPAARDPLFRLMVIERRERRTFRRRIALLLSGALMLGLLLAVGAPTEGLVFSVLKVLLFVLAVGVATTTLLPLFKRVLRGFTK